MPEAPPQDTRILFWLLQSGGFAPLGLGLILAVIGIFFLIRPSRAASVVLTFLSLLPAICGLIIVYSAAADYADMATSPTPPKPIEFAKITGRAMSSSFCGLLGTIVATSVAVLVQCRSYKCVNTLDAETKSGKGSP